MKPQMLQKEARVQTIKLSKLVFASRASLEGATPKDTSHFPDLGGNICKGGILSPSHGTRKSLGK